ncbi:MAG: hypothetical protein ACFFDW_16240 [Candidatus Thorarchaeota archaeon]
MYTKNYVKEKRLAIDALEDLKAAETQDDLIENKDGLFVKRLPTRQSIHQEIESNLFDKLYTIIENIEVLLNGEWNFKPYQDSDIIRIEAFLDKKFKEKILDRKKDTSILAFLEKIKIEKEYREFGTIL